MDKNSSQKIEFSAEAFVRCLLEEGTKNPCDETATAFKENTDLPQFYDETLYKRSV